MPLGQVTKESIAWLSPRRAIVHGPRRASKSVAITFDDGPDPNNTERILDILSEAEAHATFFLVGKTARSSPGLVRQIHGRGHQVANHSFLHRNARLRPVDEIIADVEQGQATLEDIVGAPLKRDFRPPYGAITPRSFLAVTRLDFRFVFWSIDSLDHATQTADQTFANVAGRAQGGDILLFHDDCSATALALPRVLDDIRSRGLACEPVDSFRR